MTRGDPSGRRALNRAKNARRLERRVEQELLFASEGHQRADDAVCEIDRPQSALLVVLTFDRIRDQVREMTGDAVRGGARIEPTMVGSTRDQVEPIEREIESLGDERFMDADRERLFGHAPDCRIPAGRTGLPAKS